MKRVIAWIVGVAAICLVCAAASASETITYTYDALGRLTAVQSAGDVNDGQAVSTTYDAAGNRTNQTVTGVSAPQLSIGDASVTEGGTLSFTVTRTGSTSGAVSASYATGDGTATAPGDYTANLAGTVSFASGQATAIIEVPTSEDALIEGDETMTVTLSAATGGATIVDATGTGTIVDDEVAAQLAIGDASATEGGTLTFTVTRSGDTSSAVSVNYATSDDSAVAPGDYAATSGTLNFAANQTTATIAVTTVDDSTFEAAEAMKVTLSAASTGAVISNAVATGTITDNDTAPVQLSVADASVTEGGTLSFPVTLSQSSASAVTVQYATADGSATAGSDYVGATGTLTFNPGETSKTIAIATSDDNYVESAETMTLGLSSPSGATILDAAATGTINDNDNPAVTFSISDATVTEGGNLTFTVTKSGFSFSTLTVGYTTVDGTAIAGSDYTAKTGTLSFNLAQSSQTITIATTQDSVEEATENMSVILTTASGGSGITDYTGVGTITDNDAPVPPQFSIGNASVTEGGTLSFTVTRSGTTTSAVSVDYATASGSATSGSDFTAASGTLSFASGETGKTISVATTDDSAAESAETMSVTLSNPSSGATITTATGTGTINDNDSLPAFSIADASASEGSNLSFTVTVGAHSGSVSVTAATSNGTAVAPGDYTATSQTLTFTAAQTSKTFSVVTKTDSTSESAETMNVTLSSPSSGTTIADGSAVGTINNVAPPAQLAIGNASVTEGGTLSFTVTRSGTTNTAVSAHYATAGGTATSGTDFTAKSGTVSFPANQTSAAITVSTTDDSTVESAETMTVTLSSPSSGATITTATGTGTINDNDAALIQITDGNLNVLAARQSTYGCAWDYSGQAYGIISSSCWINGGATVYSSTQQYPGPATISLGTGYSLSGGALYVQPSYYGLP